jgi:hypothetical protein
MYLLIIEFYFILKSKIQKTDEPFDSLTDFEKQKIIQEKLRIKNLNQITINVHDNNDNEHIKTPLYRLTREMKHEALNKMRQPDPKSNRTANNLIIETSQIITPLKYNEKMLKRNVTSKTLLINTDQTGGDEDRYEEEIKNNIQHQYLPESELKIQTKDGKLFEKNVEPIYPMEFTKWVKGIDLKPSNNLKKHKPIRGKRRWTKLPDQAQPEMNRPETINNNKKQENFWHLMPSTDDNDLHKLSKTNPTFGFIIEKWQNKWLSGSRWQMAHIDELILDLSSKEDNIRFKAVVVCSRGIEKTYSMNKKISL